MGNDFGTTPASGVGNYAGRYTDSDAVRTLLGTINADADADADGDGSADAGVYEMAVVNGEDEVDHYAAGGDFGIPLAFTGGTADEQDYAARTVGRWAAVLAAWWLRNRRRAGKEVPPDALDAMRAMVIRQVMAAKNGYRPLPGIEPSGDTSGPQSIAPTRDAQGLPVDTTHTPAPYARPYGWTGCS